MVNVHMYHYHQQRKVFNKCSMKQWKRIFMYVYMNKTMNRFSMNDKMIAIYVKEIAIDWLIRTPAKKLQFWWWPTPTFRWFMCLIACTFVYRNNVIQVRQFFTIFNNFYLSFNRFLQFLTIAYCELFWTRRNLTFQTIENLDSKQSWWFGRKEWH